ncbi:MAG: BON domain-containing protein [Alphaproteobacteria bacterium]
MKHSYYYFLPLIALLISGCSLAGTATGIGASLGIAASQEGGISRAASDLRIQAEINDLWFRSDVDAFVKLDLTVNQGRVLVTGVVQDPEQRVEAIRLAWQPGGVKQVINEIQVADSEGIIGFAKDAWISTRLRTALTLDKDVQSINYSIDTVNGVVYLIGAAQNQAELNRVIETARTISNVRRVVSYVKLVGKDIAQTAQSPNYEPVEIYGYEDEPVSPSPETFTPSGQATGGPQSLIESEPLDDW